MLHLCLFLSPLSLSLSGGGRDFTDLMEFDPKFEVLFIVSYNPVGSRTRPQKELLSPLSRASQISYPCVHTAHESMMVWMLITEELVRARHRSGGNRGRVPRPVEEQRWLRKR